MHYDSIVIAGMARTPIGGFLGELADVSASALGAAAIRAAVAGAGLAPHQVDEVIMGCVLAAGQGQAPARQAAFRAGLPVTAGASTLNKMCGSGMKAVMLAHDQILAGSAELIVAGGMESMSQAPYLLPRMRQGMRFGHGELKDHMLLDGLEDAYRHGTAMGVFAEDCAAEYGFERSEQDDYALQSLERAQRATREGDFKREVVAVQGANGILIDSDEGPRRARAEKIPMLKPAFRPGGSITAANSSSIADGAAALVLTLESTARRLGATPLARVIGHATFAQEPSRFTTAPVGAIIRLFKRIGWRREDVDCFEINEAFAVVVMAAIRDLGLDAARVNRNGGACALGHPIGASGARILVTLLAILLQGGGRRGVASLCIGGGEATAVALETL
ncbi:acetyl-CoA C-acyltransferase [Paludibacterium yongneupense]|uniref:acetyl-CoA C-acyltransferase n=1 Tax=Paludibacterium yongneupense TaxID=400061 RepID=UPI000419E8CC|nr:acetyl-CoA C-acyltransferase [Paludibacterium yongneupense]